MRVACTSEFQFFWRDTSIRKDFRTGVSLHSHTMYSEESLEMISRYTARVPCLGSEMRRLEAQKERVAKNSEVSQKSDRGPVRSIASHRAVWTPPLSPPQAYCIEEHQIERQFQIPALVSITDHDDIQAGQVLHGSNRF